MVAMSAKLGIGERERLNAGLDRCLALVREINGRYEEERRRLAEERARLLMVPNIERLKGQLEGAIGGKRGD